MEASKTPQVPALVPLMTKERFSELTGLGVEVVEGHLRRGYLPSLKIGKYRMINLALLNAECLAEGDWS